MEPAYVKNLGTIVEAENVDYATGRNLIKGNGADFSKMTARNTAYGRIMLGKDHDFSRNGNWIVEEVIYNLKDIENPVLYLGQGPIYNNPKIATESHRKGNEFLIASRKLVMPEDIQQYGRNWQEAIANLARNEANALKAKKISPLEMLTFELPMHETFEISVDNLAEVEAGKLSNPTYFNNLPKEIQIASVLLKDQIKDYARFLKESGVRKVPFWLVDKNNAKNEKSAFSRALWFWGIDDGSDFDGDGLVYDDRVRGVQGKSDDFPAQKTPSFLVREGAEGVAQKSAYEPIIKEFGITSEKELRKALEIYASLKGKFE